MDELRIPFEQLVRTLTEIFLKYDFSSKRAQLCADLFANANLDGVASHGLNRIPEFLRMISQGYVDVHAEPFLLNYFGVFERWDGKLGPGNLNAYFCMNRAIQSAKESGIGCIALRNTNHWMRGGSYGWQAVNEDCIGICFTNTRPNIPAWGGSEVKLGNNPMVFAVPRKESPIVLDMALSQFSYGKIESYFRREQSLPYGGGFDQEGNITKDPGVILEKELGLPVGLWKGAGLSLITDLLTSLLSEGDSTFEIGQKDEEHGISQLFLCFYLPKLGIPEFPDEKIDAILQDLQSSAVFGKEKVRFPGENTMKVRHDNLKKGVPVDKDIWENISDIL